jgi:hypothetical protein
MRKMQVFQMGALIAIILCFTACQKEQDFFSSPTLGMNDQEVFAFYNLDGSNLTGAQGSTEIKVLSQKPFTFQLNRFNNRKRLLWLTNYGVEAPFYLTNLETTILPDQTLKVIAQVEGTAIGQQDVFIAHFDAMGDLLWNARAGTEASVEILDKVEDPDFGSFVNLIEKQEDGSNVYVIVCFDPEGDPTFATGYATGNDALGEHNMVDLGETLQVNLKDEGQSTAYLIDKKEGKVKGVIHDNGRQASVTGEGTALRFQKRPLKMQKIVSNQRSRP